MEIQHHLIKHHLLYVFLDIIKKLLKEMSSFNNDDIYITGNIGDSSIGLNF